MISAQLPSGTLLEDVFRAYYDARKNKRNTKSQMLFEVDLESNLISLYNDLKNRTYYPSPSVCFVVTKPVRREIFASQFRDRVVHHLLYNYIAPIFEKWFIYDSYACRKGKGTSFGIDRIDHHIRSCTDNYTRQAYVLKLDLSGYFMSINKQRLYDIISKALKKHWEKAPADSPHPYDKADQDLVCFMLERTIFKDSTENAIIRSNMHKWDDLPASKCLSKTPKGIGLPIGDLTSQLFSNIYMGQFDNYVKRELRVKHYGRYVDDFFVIHRDKEYLKKLIPVFREYLDKELGLTIHPNKIYLQECTKGVVFLGAMVKPYRRYASNRSVKHFNETITRIEKVCRQDGVPHKTLWYYRATLNSYLGYLANFKTRKIVDKRMLRSPILSKFTYLPKKNKVVFRKQKAPKQVE